jgi:glycerate kinase
VPHLVAAPDKFRGTASAVEVAAAAARAARRAGCTTDEIALSDGGEGLLDAAGGRTMHTRVTGPLGRPVTARWQLLGDDGAGNGTGDDGRRVAVIEMAEAAGRQLVPRPGGDDPVRATTTGVGELLVAALAARADTIVVGCGGSATTDGGLGAVEAVEAAGARDRVAHTDLVVACDVTTPFREAASIFGPQKGATPDQVAELTERLDAIAARYRDHYGIDVGAIEGTGAAGGLAGGLAALHGRLVPGFGLVADLVGLEGRLAGADLVVTGEGHLDPPSLEGKVVGGLLRLVGGRVPVLCVAGDADEDTAAEVVRQGAEGTAVVSLVRRFGPERARRDTLAAVEEAVAGWLEGLGHADTLGAPASGSNLAPQGGDGP